MVEIWSKMPDKIVGHMNPCFSFPDSVATGPASFNRSAGEIPKRFAIFFTVFFYLTLISIRV
jgi:hypothetical protein